VIACIGETLQERQTGKTNEIVERQIKAYQS
jgi:triosephosphate isomerase